MAWSDDIVGLNLRIARQERYIDSIEGTKSMLLGPRGENADPDNASHTDGCDPDDTAAAAQRWTGTGGHDAYMAWWRSQNPSVDASESNTLLKALYDSWKDWSDNGSDYGAQAGMATALAGHKTNRDALVAKRDALQSKIDNSDLDGPQ
jgi:hypothetical protein